MWWIIQADKRTILLLNLLKQGTLCHMYCIVKLNIKIAGNAYFESQEISLTDLEKTYVNWNFEWVWTLFKLMDYIKQYTVESGKMQLDTFPIMSRPWQFVGKIETVAYLTANKKNAGYYWFVITLAVVSLPTNCLMSMAFSKRSIDEGNMHHCLFRSVFNL